MILSSNRTKENNNGIPPKLVADVIILNGNDSRGDVLKTDLDFCSCPVVKHDVSDSSVFYFTISG